MSTRRRAPAPTLPVGYLKSTQSTPLTSNISTQSSPFLTPPILNPVQSSPPPHVESEDYLTSKPRAGHKRRHHQSKPARKLYNTRDNASSLGSVPDQAEANRSNNGSACDICEARDPPEHDDRILDSPLQKSPIGGASPADLQHLDASKPAYLATTHRAAEIDSPAMTALRRLSQSAYDRDYPKPGALRRMSTTIATAFGLPQLSPPTSSHLSTAAASRRASAAGISPPGDASTRKRTRSTKTNDHKVTACRERNTEFASSLEIPSTISLRKPSNVGQAITGRRDTDAATTAASSRHTDAPHISPPSVELVAFYSEHRYSPTQSPSFKRADSLAPVKGRKTSVIENWSNSAAIRRQSCAAELAITYADVHIAQGTFSVSPNTRALSPVSEASAQRVSAVKLRSTSSVHEIIWREDETTSGSSISCSSHGSSSPLRATQVLTISNPSFDNNSSCIQASKAPSEADHRVPYLEAPDNEEDPKQKSYFRQVSWDEDTAAQKMDQDNAFSEETPKAGLLWSPLPEQHVVQHSSAAPSGIDQSYKPPKSGEQPAVESFPPLVYQGSAEEPKFPEKINAGPDPPELFKALSASKEQNT